MSHDAPWRVSSAGLFITVITKPLICLVVDNIIWRDHVFTGNTQTQTCCPAKCLKQMRVDLLDPSLGWLVCTHGEACLYARTHTHTHSLSLGCQFHYPTKANTAVKHSLVKSVCVCVCVCVWAHMNMWQRALVWGRSIWLTHGVRMNHFVLEVWRQYMQECLWYPWYSCVCVCVCMCVCVCYHNEKHWDGSLPCPHTSLCVSVCVCVWSSSSIFNHWQMLGWPPWGW